MSRIGHEAVQSASVTSSGSLFTGRGRLRGGIIRATATGGTAVFKDGGSGGTTICTIHTPAGVGAVPFTVPGGGIPFGTSLYVALTDADAADVFIGVDRTLGDV